jgi:hypothetical protein
LQNVKFLSKNWKAVEKFAKIGKKSFFAKGFGEFRRNPIGFLQKSCFSMQKPIFAKKNFQTFSQCPPHYPHGVRGSNPAF